MPTFEFRFRQEFAAVDPPTIKIEADRVQTVTNDGGEILCVVAARGEGADGLIPLLSANTDRLLWWRQLSEDEIAKKAITDGPPPPPPPLTEFGIGEPT